MADLEMELQEGMELPAQIFMRDTKGEALEVREHWHECIEFQYILEGRAEQFINGIRYVADRGRMPLILEGDIHAVKCKKGVRTRIMVLKFLPSLFQVRGEDQRYFQYLDSFRSDRVILPELTQKQKQMVESILTGILREKEQKSAGYELLMKAELFRLMSYLQREELFVLGKVEKRYNPAGKIGRTVLYMEQNYDRDISLREVAENLHMNYSYASQYFKKATGRNFKDYLDAVRVCEVNRMLVDGTKDIAEIAIACGFSNPQSMNRVYGRMTGNTPSYMHRFYREEKENEETASDMQRPSGSGMAVGLGRGDCGSAFHLSYGSQVLPRI